MSGISTSDIFVIGEDAKGGRLDDSTISYYRSIVSAIDSTDDTSGDIDIESAANRAIHDLPTAIYRLCVNRQGSKALQTIISRCSPIECRFFMQRIDHLVLALTGDRCASHVIQSAINRLSSLINTEFDDESQEGFEHVMSASDIINQLADRFTPHLVVLATQASSSFIIRGMIDIDLSSVLTSWTETFIDQLDQVTCNTFGSATLQHLVVTLQKRGLDDTLRPLLQAVLARFEDLVQDRAGSHLVECAVRHTPDDLYLDLLQRHCLRRVGPLSLGLTSNHVVQRLLEGVRDQAQAQLLIQPLLDQVPTLIRRGRAGVVLALVGCAARLQCMQKDVFRAVCRAHDVQDPAADKSICHRLIESHGEIGSRFVQGLVQLGGQQQRLVIESFLSAGPEWIQSLSLDRSGSHAVDTIIKSGMIPGKSLRQLCSGLDLAKLALDRYGSYCLQALYDRVDLGLKKRIVAVLSDHQQQLEATRHGPVLLAKLRVGDFKTRGEAHWEHQMGRDVNTKNIFSDIIGDDDNEGGFKPKSVKKQKEEGVIKPKSDKNQKEGVIKPKSDKKRKEVGDVKPKPNKKRKHKERS